MKPSPLPPLGRRHAAGFTLVELMVAVVLGLVVVAGISHVYLSSRTASSRQAQLSSLQQNVRLAFEYLAGDTRMAGHRGCFTRSATSLVNTLPATDIASNFLLGLEGYEYGAASAPEAITLSYSSSSPSVSVSTDATGWSTSSAPGTISPIPLAALSASGLAENSDVLVIRTVSGRPVRLTANASSAVPSLTIESIPGSACPTSGGASSNNRVSGFCNGSFGLIASCTNAQAFAASGVPNVSGTTATLNVASLSADYAIDRSEVFPLQTVAYYVRASGSNASPGSLYRRVFDGTDAAGIEQELIENVESVQFRYGVDTSPTDGVIDGYVTAVGVGNWNNVMAVRMSVLLRSPDPLPADSTAPASATMNGGPVTFPNTSPRQFDRRVFTTTVALRNVISTF